MRVGGRAILGWDMTAALALGQALGIDRGALAEFLPDIEAQMVRRLNEQIKTGFESDG